MANPYGYSHPYYSLPLPNQYMYWYPQYPPPPMYGPVPHRSPRHRRRDLTPSPPPNMEIHPILKRSHKLFWAVLNNPFEGPSPYFATPNSSPQHIPPALLAEPATEPAISTMRIVSDEFQWEITIMVSDVVTVKHVLGAIHGTLQEPLEQREWEGMSSNARKNAHRARCMRIAKGPARFALGQEVGELRRIDTLGDRIIFMGLKPVGRPGDPDEWIVKLGLPPTGRR